MKPHQQMAWQPTDGRPFVPMTIGPNQEVHAILSFAYTIDFQCCLWHCSVTWVTERGPFPTGRITKQHRSELIAVGRNLLIDVGNPSFEFVARQNHSLMIYRYGTTEEADGTTNKARVMLGGCVEILPPLPEWELPLSVRPCRHLNRHVVDRKKPELWIAQDCGNCLTCLARTALIKNEEKEEALPDAQYLPGSP